MNAKDEEFVPEEEAEQGPALIAKLREKLKKAVEEKQEYLEGWQRSRADFANFKKEEAALLQEKEERIKGEVLGDLLPALDALDMALRHKPSDELSIVKKQLSEGLRRLGIEAFGEIGEPFDPRKHEPLTQKENGEKVVSIERSGYKIGDTIIRPAQVII